MEETWYIEITRHLEDGRDMEELYVTDVCAKEFSSKGAAQKFIDEWLDTGKNQLAPGERAMPTYEPITAAMFKRA